MLGDLRHRRAVGEQGLGHDQLGRVEAIGLSADAPTGWRRLQPSIGLLAD
jgi:hypothetical protein